MSQKQNSKRKADITASDLAVERKIIIRGFLEKESTRNFTELEADGLNLLQEFIFAKIELEKKGLHGIYLLTEEIIGITKRHNPNLRQYEKTDILFRMSRISFLNAKKKTRAFLISNSKIINRLFSAENQTSKYQMFLDFVGSYFLCKENLITMQKPEFVAFISNLFEGIKKYQGFYKSIHKNENRKVLKQDIENKTISIRTEGGHHNKFDTAVLTDIIREYEYHRKEFKALGEGIFDDEGKMLAIQQSIAILDRVLIGNDEREYLRNIFEVINSIPLKKYEAYYIAHEIFSAMDVRIVKRGVCTQLTQSNAVEIGMAINYSEYRQAQRREVLNAISIKKTIEKM